MGGLFLVVALVFLVRWVRRVQRRHALEHGALTEQLLATEQQRLEFELEGVFCLTILNFTASELRRSWEILEAELQLGAVVGRGAMGVVHRGRWRDMVVAVKVIGGAWQESKETQAEMDREAKMMMAVRHPNIVSFLGAGIMVDGSPFLVTEFMEFGSLRRVLETREVAWDVKVRIALEVARGMALVHSLGRMHRDLKADNILMTSDMHAKIADFGTAGLVTMAMAISAQQPPEEENDVRTMTQRTKGVGTPLWMAPEMLAWKKYDAKVDVYSFGIVMWEIASQRLPWEDVQGTFLLATLLATIESGRRPATSEGWPRGYCAVMEQCWQLAPSDRPDFETVGRMLRGGSD